MYKEEILEIILLFALFRAIALKIINYVIAILQ